jgi:hypothetical protein
MFTKQGSHLELFEVGPESVGNELLDAEVMFKCGTFDLPVKIVWESRRKQACLHPIGVGRRFDGGDNGGYRVLFGRGFGEGRFWFGFHRARSCSVSWS